MQRTTFRIALLMLLFIIAICICYFLMGVLSAVGEKVRLMTMFGYMKTIGYEINAYCGKNGSCPEGDSLRNILETIGMDMSKMDTALLGEIRYHAPEFGNWFRLSWESQPKHYLSPGRDFARKYHYYVGFANEKGGCFARRIWDNADSELDMKWMTLTSAPAENAEISLMKRDWRKAIQDCLKRGKTESGYGDYESEGFPEPVHFSWKNGKPPYLLVLKTDGGQIHCFETESDSIDVYNLMVAKKYEWRLEDSEKTTFYGTFSTARTPRLMNLPDRTSAPVNVRDMGGYLTASGKSVRQGLVFRGSDFKSDSAPDIAAMSDSNRNVLLNVIKITTELDLRYREQAADQKGSGISPSVRWLHYPVNAYNPFDDAMNALFRDAMRCFAEESNYPIYVHCSGGVDRTGEICFLLGALLGMDEEDLFIDYELSTLSRFPRPRDIPYFQEWLKRVAAFSPRDGDGLSYQTKVENYLLGIGVSKQEIEAIRAIMLE